MAHFRIIGKFVHDTLTGEVFWMGSAPAAEAQGRWAEDVAAGRTEPRRDLGDDTPPMDVVLRFLRDWHDRQIHKALDNGTPLPDGINKMRAIG